MGSQDYFEKLAREEEERRKGLLQMTADEHIALAAQIGASSCNSDEAVLKQLAVQTHLLWAICKGAAR